MRVPAALPGEKSRQFRVTTWLNVWVNAQCTILLPSRYFGVLEPAGGGCADTRYLSYHITVKNWPVHTKYKEI